MGRIMFGFVFFVCTYAYFMGILNSLGSFGLPAMAPALLNIAMLCFTFMPPSWFPQPGDGLAWGVLVGGFLQMLLVWSALRAKNYVPRWQLHFNGQDVKLSVSQYDSGSYRHGSFAVFDTGESLFC